MIQLNKPPCTLLDYNYNPCAQEGQKPPSGIYSAKTLWWKILPGAYLRGANDFGWHQKYFDCLPNMNNVMREACKNLN